MEVELMYWLPPSRVKQSGKATTTGDMRCSPISRSSRSGRFSRKPVQFVWERPLPVNPTRSTSKGNPCPSCPAGSYTSTTRTDGSPSILLLRAWLSIVTRLTEPIDPKNLRMHPTPVFADIMSGHQRTMGPSVLEQIHGTIAPPFCDAKASAVAWLTAWDSHGTHRTGTTGDEAGAVRLAHEAAGLGV